MTNAQDPTLFIGSSSEGLGIAQYLQSSLDDYCEGTVWNQGVFGLSGLTISDLEAAAAKYDFAALVLTPDDMVEKRDQRRPAARDNVVLEAGIFIGALGLERVFLVHCRDEEIDIPTDLAGVTRATFRQRADENLRAALGPVALEMRESFARVGLRRAHASRPSPPARPHNAPARSMKEEGELLARELDALSTSAEAQGWTVKTRSASAFRLLAPDGTRFSLTVGDPAQTRDALRPFAKEINEVGLRLSQALLTPVDGDLSGLTPVRARERPS